MSKAITVFDMDGCISNDLHRRHLLPQQLGAVDADYKPYTALCKLDEPCNQVLWTKAAIDSRIVVITARGVSAYADTRDWLNNYFAPGESYDLLMRPEGDARHSPTLKPYMLYRYLKAKGLTLENVVRVYDDRLDVLKAYLKMGVAAHALYHLDLHRNPKLLNAGRRSVDEILSEMALTFRERNAVYRDNYKQIPQLIKILFPQGVPPELVETDQWHLFELKLVKLSRFAVSNLTHMDSIHDDAVYSAMIESILSEDE
jgi:hypothetical protein